MYQLDFLAILIALVLYRFLKRRKQLPLPPGPSGYPIIGNLFDMPLRFTYLTFTEWAKKYNSEIVHIDVCGTHIIILNSLRLIIELFDKRSTIYSSRPRFTMVNELMGWEFLFSSMPYDEGWRRRRRLFQRIFPSSRASELQPQQRTHVRRLLPRLIDPKQHYAQALRHFTGGIAITLAYGINVKPENDPYINISERAIGILNRESTPGKYFVDAIPWLKYVPEWFPGAKFKRDAKEWKKVTMNFRDAPFQATKRDMEKGVVPSSYTASCLENINANTAQERHELEEEIKDTAATFYGGGTDTMMSVLLTFVLAMLRYPSVQQKAQEELDKVVGPDRLPDFKDSPNLPYLNAILRELIRWRPSAPVAIPHFTTEEDIVDGYLIPKGSIIIPNNWAVLQDAETYPNPTNFSPERFLTSSGAVASDIINPIDVILGYGRRSCPGAHMARSNMFITTACILHTMTLSWPPSAKGHPDDVRFNDALFPSPEPFPCLIEPRSPKAEQLIKDEAFGAY
ncbi:hypothetical protein NP233_g2187 [Leucocoprinus birnbaumii]|uniref:Cytochrome P450 n=1 Tax=Leucocoprinus birnbaumii TaxID=56174 RepID=A0AAD5VYQ8_9AGAR|nr:hypothetical protein NP233_g2187 [Leucocoprinus birnbaumii]